MAEEIVYNHTSAIAAAFPVAVDQIVRKAAFDLERLVKKNVQEKHIIDTGFLFNSIYTVTSESSGYAAAQAMAAARAGRQMEPPMPIQPRMTARVVVGAAYGIYQERGTVNQPARPFLAPALERIKPAFESAFLQLEGKLREMGG